MGLFNRQKKVDAAEILAPREELDGLRQRLAAHEHDQAALVEQLEANQAATQHATDELVVTNERITNVSAELANQVRELGTELDTVQAAREPAFPAPTPVVQTQALSDEVLTEIQQAQIRLANEQARYAIAFKQDLADLAESLKRNR